MCISYRGLNKITNPFEYPISRCDVVIEDVGRVKAVVVQKLWPEVVDDGAEGETRPEGAGHVLYPHIVVASHHSSDPNLTNAYN